jgi:predicted RNase H-like HicB family nuclease
MATQKRAFDVIVERDVEGWYVASVPALPGCHTQARSLDDLQGRIVEAILLCLDAGGGRPEDEALEYVGVQRVMA